MIRGEGINGIATDLIELCDYQKGVRATRPHYEMYGYRVRVAHTPFPVKDDAPKISRPELRIFAISFLILQFSSHGEFQYCGCCYSSHAINDHYSRADPTLALPQRAE